MTNFFQVSESVERYGSNYRATIFVDNDRKEAFLSFSQDNILQIVNYPIRYGRVWNPRMAKSTLTSRRGGFSLLTMMAHYVGFPLKLVSRFDDLELTIA